MTTKREQLCSIVNDINNIHIVWRDNTDRVLWKQNRVHDWYKQVTPDFFPAVTDLINFIANDEFEADAYELVMACDEFVDLWLDWIKELNSDRKDVRLDGGEALWNAWGRAVQAQKVRTFPGLEPIEQLISGKVSSLQICKIYGFLDDTGRPDLDVLTKAKLDGVPEGWVNPIERDYNASLEVKWQGRLDSFADGSRNWEIERKAPVPEGGDGIDRTEWKEALPSVENLEQLLRLPRITSNQISQMTGLSVEEINDFALDMGIAVSGSAANDLLDVDDPRAGVEFSKNREKLQDQIDRKKNAEAKKVDNYKELGDDIITRVFSMTDDGVGAGAILRSLKDEFPLTTYEQVLGWQARRESLMAEVVEKAAAEAVEAPKKKATKKKPVKKAE